MDFLSRLLGRTGGTAVSEADADHIRRDLSRLEGLAKGLGRQAADFVLTGAGEGVLAALELHGASQGKDPLELGARFTRDHRTINRRRTLLRADPWDSPTICRYGLVLAALMPAAEKWWCGTQAVPHPLRLIFNEALREHANYYPPRIETPEILAQGNGLSLAHAREVAGLLGGSDADLMDILFSRSGSWDQPAIDSYGEAIDMRGFVQAAPDALIAAAGRVGAEGRALIVANLAKWQMAAEPRFRETIVDMIGDSAKAVREAALGVAAQLPAGPFVDACVRRLGAAPAARREALAVALGRVGGAEAEAALREHLEGEKSARVRTAIEGALSIPAASGAEAVQDSPERYVAIDGSVVEIPPAPPLPDDPPVKLDAAMRRDIDQAIADATAEIAAENRNRQRFQRRLIESDVVTTLLSLFDSDLERLDARATSAAFSALSQARASYALGDRLLQRLPPQRRLKVALVALDSRLSFLIASGFGETVDALWGVVNDFLESDLGDLRTLEALAAAAPCEIALSWYWRPTNRPISMGGFLRLFCHVNCYHDGLHHALPARLVWPYCAANFAALDEAFGLAAAAPDFKPSRPRAAELLTVFPKTPLRYYGPLMELATGAAKTGRATARRLLADAPGVDDRLVALLSDSRQEMRAGAAEWLAERRVAAAVPPLRKALKKERSELGRAAMLTALSALGADLSAFLGRKGLLAEAEAGLKNARLDKLDWLGLDHLPPLAWRGGGTVPAEVIRWWIAVADRLKQPGGNALFEIYLDQLAPESAARLSEYLLTAWVAHDTRQPTEAEANRHAEANADQTLAMWRRWDKEMTRERVFAALRRDMLSAYLGSAATHKGLLGLATRTPPVKAAALVRAYLKEHGARTSQAQALLDLLAAMAVPVTLQVVIAAATRLKQKSVQAHAGALVEAAAARLGWSRDELGDRTVPTAGLDDAGVLELSCGPDARLYRATLDDELRFVLANPDGKPVKALPSGGDETTKAAKKALGTAKRELGQIVKLQAGRLYEALCAERAWSADAWARDFAGHPVMRRLAERLVWLGLDAAGTCVAAFRPLSDGGLSDAEDAPVTLDGLASVRLAHGALLSDDAAAAWQAHLADYEVKPLFQQFGRALRRLPEGWEDRTEIDERKGWMTDTFTIRGIATKLGYERGEVMDGGFFNEYVKRFDGAGLAAAIEFTGNFPPEENRPAALIALRFERTGQRRSVVVKLKEVPPVLLSECWNDLDAMAARAAFDADWEKKTQW